MLTPVTVSDRNVPADWLAIGEEKDLSHGSPKKEHKTCVLIVEDNPGDVFIMEAALQEHRIDCETTVLSDGEQAASFFERMDRDSTVECPGIVLLDLNLPKLSGHLVLSRIRASIRCSLVPVVIVSSSQAPADMEQNRSLGATAYFRKPTSLDNYIQLGALVKSLLHDS